MLSNFMLQHLFFCYRKVWFSDSLGLKRARDLLNFGHIDTGSTLLSFALWETPITNYTNHQKKAIWARITDKINALGVAIRTASEVRDKWRNTTL
jgi:hypothetical protein